ncbi:MAG: hypothetical protein HKL99_12915 [Burkholderiales bacterium]|nr:hypothetical protein [Burkholderiales bacterium]
MKTTATHQQNQLFTRVARLVGYLASAKAGAWLLAMILPFIFSAFASPSAAQSVGAYPVGAPIWFALSIPMIGAGVGIFLFWAWARFDSLGDSPSALDDVWDRAAEMLRSDPNALGEGRDADTARIVLAHKLAQEKASAHMNGNGHEADSVAAKA